MKNTIDLVGMCSLKIFLILFLLFPICNIMIAQNIRWFECKYFNQGTDIQYLHNPYTNMEVSSSKTRLLISADYYGITIYNSNGPSHFYKHNFLKYKLNSGKNIELHEGINDERQYYIMGITAPFGVKRQLYDSSIIIATRTHANLYGTVLLYSVNLKDQVIDDKFSINVDSTSILSNSEIVSKYSSIKRILISEGKRINLDQDQFDLKVMKGNSSVRHYIVENDGTELIVREAGNNFTISKSFTDGGLIRYYASRK
jgi:hypothetical protein